MIEAWTCSFVWLPGRVCCSWSRQAEREEPPAITVEQTATQAMHPVHATVAPTLHSCCSLSICVICMLPHGLTSHLSFLSPLYVSTLCSKTINWLPFFRNHHHHHRYGQCFPRGTCTVQPKMHSAVLSIPLGCRLSIALRAHLTK